MKTKDIINQLYNEMPLKTALYVPIQLSMITLLSEIGFREEKLWTNEEESTLKTLSELANNIAKDLEEELVRDYGCQKTPIRRLGQEDLTKEEYEQLFSNKPL